MSAVFIVAEAGSNWHVDGESLSKGHWRAIRLIDVAVAAGADAVKFQAFRADDLYPKDTENWNIVKPLEIPIPWIADLSSYCTRRGIEFMCSAFSEEMVDAVDPYVKRHKVASLEITDLSLLRHIASKGKPVIMSTGAATEDQIKDARMAIWNPLGKWAKHAIPITLLHCVTGYPTPPHEANLLALPLSEIHLDGLSDHTLDPIIAPVMAVALGASMIEKHFTLSRSLVGPDHHYALEPYELMQMVEAVRLAEKMLGDGRKRVMPSELKWRQFQHRDGGVRGA